MNRDEIICMAREAGGHCHHGDFNMGHSYEFQPDQLEYFAALVAAAEREKLIFNDERVLKSIGFQLEVDKFIKAIEAERESCAKLCDELADDAAKKQDFHALAAAESCSEAIRARGKT